MARNPLTQVRLGALRGELEVKRAVKQRLMDDVAEVVLLRNFFQTATSSGFPQAITDLPDDNPDTPGVNEEVTVSDIHEAFQEIFPGGSFPDTRAEASEMVEEINAINTSVMNKIRQLLGNVSMINTAMDDITREIKDINNLEKSDSG